MTKTNDTPTVSHQDRMPFLIFHNNLDMFSKIIDSSCKMSLALLEGTKPTEAQMKAALAAHERNAKYADGMIPSTEDMQAATEAVTTAMNEAAQKALAAISAEGKAETPSPEAVKSAKKTTAARSASAKTS